MISMRKATREDMFDVLMLVKEGSSPENPTWLLINPAPAAGSTVEFVSEQIAAGLVYVAIKDDKIVGIIIYAERDYELNRAVKALIVVFLYLKPEARKGLDGLELVEHLHEMQATTKLPVILTIHDIDNKQPHAAMFERRGWKNFGHLYMLPMED